MQRLQRWDSADAAASLALNAASRCGTARVATAPWPLPLLSFIAAVARGAVYGCGNILRQQLRATAQGNAKLVKFCCRN